MAKTEAQTISGIDEQVELCDCFDKEDTGIYWRIVGEVKTLGFLNNRAYISKWGGKLLTIYGRHVDDGINSFIPKIRHFKCSGCRKVHKRSSLEFDKLVRLVLVSFKRDGWEVESNI